MEGNKKILLGVVLVVLVGLAVWLNWPESSAYVPGNPEENQPVEIGAPAAPERKPSRERDRDESASSRGNVEQLGGGESATGPRDTARIGNKGSGGAKPKKPSVPIG